MKTLPQSKSPVSSYSILESELLIHTKTLGASRPEQIPQKANDSMQSLKDLYYIRVNDQYNQEWTVYSPNSRQNCASFRQHGKVKKKIDKVSDCRQYFIL